MEEVLMAKLGIAPDPAYVLSTFQMILYMGTIMLGTLMMSSGLLIYELRGYGSHLHWSLKFLFCMGTAAWVGTVYCWPISMALLALLVASLPPLATLIAIVFWVAGWCAFTQMMVLSPNRVCIRQ